MKINLNIILITATIFNQILYSSDIKLIPKEEQFSAIANCLHKTLILNPECRVKALEKLIDRFDQTQTAKGVHKIYGIINMIKLNNYDVLK